MKSFELILYSLLAIMLVLLINTHLGIIEYNYELALCLFLFTLTILHIILYHLIAIKINKKLKRKIKDNEIEINILQKENKSYAFNFTEESIKKFIYPRLGNINQTSELNNLQKYFSSQHKNFLHSENYVKKDNQEEQISFIDKIVTFMSVIKNLLDYYQYDEENIKKYYTESSLDYKELEFIYSYLELSLTILEITIIAPELFTTKYSKLDMVTFPTISPIGEMFSSKISPKLSDIFQNTPSGNIYYLLKLGYEFNGKKHLPAVLIK